MVGYNPNEEQVPWFIISMAGGASGIFTRAVTQPLDVVKIRLQVQDTSRYSRKYRGTLHSMRTVVVEEGMAALWKGHAPAQVLSLLYGLLQFSGFDLFSNLTHPLFSVSPFLQPLQDFICGSVSGVLATVVSYPFDTVRTRYIIQANPPVYSSMLQTFKIIIKKESASGLYRGLVPTLVQIAPNTGFQFAFYQLSSQLWDHSIHRFKKQELLLKNSAHPNRDSSSPSSLTPSTPSSSHHSVTKSLVCGSLAGLAAKSLIYPLDFTKKRLQAEGIHAYSSAIVGKAHNYTGFLNCIVTVVRKEGFTAVYKGFVPSSLKAIATSALIFSSYEHFKDIFSDLHKSFR